MLEARKEFEEELVLDPTNARAAYELAELKRKAGELDAARKLFEQAVTHYPAFEHALVGLARTLIALGRPADALPHLRAALKANPENEVAHYQVAQAYRALGNTPEQEKALAEFNRARSQADRARPRCPKRARTSHRRCSTSNLRNDASNIDLRAMTGGLPARILGASAAIASCLAILHAWGPESVTFTDVTKESGITFSHVWSPRRSTSSNR